MSVISSGNIKKDFAALAHREMELEQLLAEVWAKTESYRGRMDYHMMLRGESKKAYEELKARVEKALDQDRARCIVPLQEQDGEQ